MDIEVYNHIRSDVAGFHEQKRGLIAVWGKEAVQFLDGMITNDMKTLEDGQQMLAAFPNPQGRLIAVVRVMRQGDRFLFETEEATREKLYQNLFRFTFAGDFFVEELSGNYRYFDVFDTLANGVLAEGTVRFEGRGMTGYFIPSELADDLIDAMSNSGGRAVDDETFETLRIEAGVPKFGVDMDETTIVPELGFPEMISYTKGCYVGQEIIARIHFRGHVAKQLTGIVSEQPIEPGAELISSEGKAAGRVTSVTYSPRLEKSIALAYVRYDYLAPGTELGSGDHRVAVTQLPFIE
jgi:tRNA-modifying protein YgfZ